MANQKKLTFRSKPHEWQVDDPLKAKWLQADTKSIKELQDTLKKLETSTDSKLKAINTNAYQHGGNAIRQATEYDETNTIHYRDHDAQTADLAGEDDPTPQEDGYYGNVHYVQYGVYQQHLGDVKTISPDAFVTDKDTTVWTEITTDTTGVPIESHQIALEAGQTPSNTMWDIKFGVMGKLYIPTAITRVDDINGERKIAVKHRPHQLPAITQDASWTPDKAVGTDSGGEPINGRSVQGDNLIEPLKGNTTPGKGLNNHGGIKILGDDANGNKKSLGVLASIEMYGVCGSEYEAVGSKQNIRMMVVGSDDDGNIKRELTEREITLYQPYNQDTPYYTSGDGILAQWPIYDSVGSHISDLTLEGGHFEDWQLWFRSSGAITLSGGGDLPDVVHTQTVDYKTEFESICADGQMGLRAWTYQREEHWGENGKLENNWRSWEPAGSFEIMFPVGTAVVGSATDYRYRAVTDSTGGVNNLTIWEETRTELFGENGEHKDTWTDWETTGSIVNWDVVVGTATTGSAKDYKTEASVDMTDPSKACLYLFHYERTESFGNNGESKDEWGDWQATGSTAFIVPLVGSISPQEAHCLEIRTLPVGTPGPDDYSRFIGNKLLLVQSPIEHTVFINGPLSSESNCSKPVTLITGYRLV